MSAISISWRLTVRNLKLIPRVPSTFLPSMLMPVFLLIAFTGQFSDLVNLPGFPGRKMIDWMLPFVLIMGGAFAGVTTGMGVARDIEGGFYDRLLLTPSPRSALLIAPMAAAGLRAFLPMVILGVAGFVGQPKSPGLDGAVLAAAAMVGCSVAAGAWATGLAYRLQTMQAAPIMQVGVFLLMFTSTVQMPLDLLTGWLHDVARYNPMTPVLAMARQGFLGEVTWSDTWPGLVSIAGLIVITGAFAGLSLGRLSQERRG